MGDSRYEEPKGSMTASYPSFDHGGIPSSYGDEKPGYRRLVQRVWDSFKRNPNAHFSKADESIVNGKVFDMEVAAINTASSPLRRDLKGRHLQMIAIGGSIGKHSISQP
jgi:amino acid transporter